MVTTELVDDTAYAEIDDVRRIYDGRDFTAGVEAKIHQWLAEASESIDNRTNRAWRERRNTDWQARVELNGRQKRRMKAYTGQRWPLRQQDRRGFVRLPHPDVRQIESIKLIYPDSEKTLDPATDIGPDKDLQVNYKRGIIRPDISLLSIGSRRHGAYSNPDVRVEVTYTYGRQQVPYDIERACAFMVASDVAHTDQHSSVVSGGGDEMDMQESVRNWRNQAEQIINEHRYIRRL